MKIFGLLFTCGAVLASAAGCSSNGGSGPVTSPSDAAPSDGTSPDGFSSPDTGSMGDASAPPRQDASLDAAATPDGSSDALAAQDGAEDAPGEGGDSGPVDAGVAPASWMGAIPGTTSLAALSIPGTHDTGATVEVSPGTTKTQNLSVDDQLAIGVRYFDIRCRNVSNKFEVFHTSVDQNLSFDQVLQSIYAFFTAHPGETLVMSLKEEIAATGSTNTFEQTFDSYVAQHPERWSLGATIPTLDPVRGKIVLLRRFSATTLPTGIDATVWADNTTFTIANGSATLRIQDYYQVTDDPSKWSAILNLFNEAVLADAGTLYLNNTSAYFQLDSGLEDIPSVSNVINPEVAAYLMMAPPERYGIVAMDFVDATRSSLILSKNFP